MMVKTQYTYGVDHKCKYFTSELNISYLGRYGCRVEDVVCSRSYECCHGMSCIYKGKWRGDNCRYPNGVNRTSVIAKLTKMGVYDRVINEEYKEPFQTEKD
jgi:hypothetical protein